ncbi:hypothetical protein HG531_013307 [Fusarium graminearum]|nr:hypothetical protein HG531_013307 [Fusarium graminearum]
MPPGLPFFFWLPQPQGSPASLGSSSGSAPHSADAFLSFLVPNPQASSSSFIPKSPVLPFGLSQGLSSSFDSGGGGGAGAGCGSFFAPPPQPHPPPPNPNFAPQLDMLLFSGGLSPRSNLLAPRLILSKVVGGLSGGAPPPPLPFPSPAPPAALPSLVPPPPAFISSF